MFEALLDLMSRALEGLSSLPWGVHAAMALAMAAGIVLWLCGQRVLKPLLVTVAVLMGAVIGGLVVPSTTWGEPLGVWQGMGLGGVLGLLIGLLLYRSAMAVGFGVVLGAALPLISASVLEFYPIAGAAEGTRASVGRAAEDGWSQVGEWKARVPAGGASVDGVRVIAASWMDDGGGSTAAAEIERAVGRGLRGSEGGKTALSAEQLPENLRPAAECIGQAWSTATACAREQWNQMPSEHRAVVGLAGVIGLAGGVVAGLLMPAWAGGMVTSLFGAAVWLPCFVWLSSAMRAPWREWLDRSPAAWLAIWGAVALAGMIVQWRSAAKRTAQSKPAPAAA